MIIRNKEFDIDKHTYIFGILNVTPDSFSDGGKYADLDDILYGVERMIADGADVIDIGGESTRPGYERITEDEEIGRIEPALRAVRRSFDVPISIDTYKPKVARAAIECGADIVNDIWGVRCDREMLEAVRDSGAAYVLMHNREEPMPDEKEKEFLENIRDELKKACSEALGYGIAREKIIADVGIGFGKTFEQNLWILKDPACFKHLGFPLFLGASRKSVIGNALGLETGERVEGTIVTSILAASSISACPRTRREGECESNKNV